MVFDEDNEQEQNLIGSVIARKEGQTIVLALLEAGIKFCDELHQQAGDYERFMEFIERTPELRLYAQRKWLRHEKALAAVVKKESTVKVSLLEAEAIARTVLNFYQIAFSKPQARDALKSLFKILEEGWGG